MKVKHIVERIQKICPNLGIKEEKMCKFTIDENEAVDQINELMNDLFEEYKNKPFNSKELKLINPIYQGWFGLTIEADVKEEEYKCVSLFED